LSLISVADISSDGVMRNEGRKANDHAGGINMREENNSKENDREGNDHTGSVDEGTEGKARDAERSNREMLLLRVLDGN
jgi:hypothetical protein